MFDIVTCICVDENKEDAKSSYPLMGGVNAVQRRLMYWRLVTIMCATAKRVYPEQNMLVYTNDKEQVIIEGLNVTGLLESWGVKIVRLPFAKYKYPPGLGDMFLNAFYKLDVIAHLAEGANGSHSIMLDSDCVWVRRSPELERMITSDALVLLDIYHRPPEENQPHNKNAYDFAAAYRLLNPDYPNPTPIWYGGEVIAGSSETFKKANTEMEFAFKAAVDSSLKKGAALKVAQSSIFDGDEYISNYAFNKVDIPIKDVTPYLQRIWDAPHYNNVNSETINKTIWHMPSEKRKGFKLVFPMVVDPNSLFWKTDIAQFPEFLGGYLGVPKRLHFVKEDKPSFLSRVKGKIARIIK